MLRLLVVLALLAVPTGLASAKTGPDFTVELRPDASPTYEGPAGLVRLADAARGERYEWRITPSQDYTVGEFRIRGNLFNVTRVEQVTPTLEDVPEDRYPLFVRFPNEELWTADGPAQVYRYNGSPQDFVLRLGFPAGNATLVLARDVTPPTFTLGPVTNVTHISFLQETRTGEFALANLRIRPAAGGEWVENPTPTHHVIQRFPIQGLDADTEYVAQVEFTDWAGNAARSEPYRVRTAPAPVVPLPAVTVLEPAANATVPNGSVVIRARVLSPDSPIEGGSLRLFVDKREVNENMGYDGENFTYAPAQPFAPGFHSVSLEATNAAGGKSVARWSFTVEEPARGVPMLPALALVALLVGLALARRR